MGPAQDTLSVWHMRQGRGEDLRWRVVGHAAGRQEIGKEGEREREQEGRDCVLSGMPGIAVMAQDVQ